LVVGKLIRRVLRQEQGVPGRASLPWLFAADRSDHLLREIAPAIDQGTHVVTDRYVPSSLAYQALEIDMDRVWSLNADFRAPDLTVFLYIDVDVALDRIAGRGEDTEVYEQRDLLQRVAQNYTRAIDLLEAKGWPVVRIDASLPMDTIEMLIWQATSALGRP
jgi:dTMP kinase